MKINGKPLQVRSLGIVQLESIDTFTLLKSLEAWESSAGLSINADILAPASSRLSEGAVWGSLGVVAANMPYGERLQRADFLRFVEEDEVWAIHDGKFAGRQAAAEIDRGVLAGALSVKVWEMFLGKIPGALQKSLRAATKFKGWRGFSQMKRDLMFLHIPHFCHEKFQDSGKQKLLALQRPFAVKSVESFV